MLAKDTNIPTFIVIHVHDVRGSDGHTRASRPCMYVALVIQQD
jgi:hypothetical protein